MAPNLPQPLPDAGVDLIRPTLYTAYTLLATPIISIGVTPRPTALAADHTRPCNLGICAGGHIACTAATDVVDGCCMPVLAELPLELFVKAEDGALGGGVDVAYTASS